MASPLREARDDDWRAKNPATEPKANEKPEAAPGGGENDAAKPPGDLLVFLKADLSDHRPWLESQFAAIQAGRERHERRLASQRQEEAAKNAQAEPPVESQDELPKSEEPQEPQDAQPEIEEPEAAGAATRLRATLEPYAAKLPGRLTASATQIGERVSAGIAATYAKSRGAVSSALVWSKAKAETLSPATHDWIATAADRTKRTAAPLLGKTQAVLRSGAESASSSLARMREADRRQVLIAAGAALLVCGALLIGSGLLWRAGAPTAQDAAEPIVWSFETPSQSASHRIVFMLSDTPAQFRIGGLAFRGESNLAHPMTGIEAVVKADKPKPDLKLNLRIGRTQALAGELHSVEVPLAPAASPTDDVIPAGAPFELVAAFSGDGLSPEEFFEAYGGLTLTMRYTAEGKQRTLIQYFSPEMLQAQLAEVQAMGS